MRNLLVLFVTFLAATNANAQMLLLPSRLEVRIQPDSGGLPLLPSPPYVFTDVALQQVMDAFQFSGYEQEYPAVEQINHPLAEPLSRVNIIYCDSCDAVEWIQALSPFVPQHYENMYLMYEPVLVNTMQASAPQRLLLIPNPTASEARLPFTPENLYVFNLLGQAIGVPLNDRVLDFSSFQQGIYQIIAEKEGEFYAGRLVLSR